MTHIYVKTLGFSAPYYRFYSDQAGTIELSTLTFFQEVLTTHLNELIVVIRSTLVRVGGGPQRTRVSTFKVLGYQ